MGAPTVAYEEDLAFIHDAGFGDIARGAARVLLEALAARGPAGGLVVDLGCGSGILAAECRAAGYDVFGVDISEEMVRLARGRAPGARFVRASLFAVDIPPCVAVACIGEGVNYLFDERDPGGRLADLLRRVYAALSPGGLLLFDAAGPGRVPPPGEVRSWLEGDGWAVLVHAREDAASAIVERRIIAFREVAGSFRRSEEVHRLRLYDVESVTRCLHDAGFACSSVKDHYAGIRLPLGVRAFLAIR